MKDRYFEVVKTFLKIKLTRQKMFITFTPNFFNQAIKLIIFFLLMSPVMVSAQEVQSMIAPDPVNQQTDGFESDPNFTQSTTSRWFGSNSTATNSRYVKSFLNTPETNTGIGPVLTNVWAYAGELVAGKYYTIETNASNITRLMSVDTATGVRTTVATVSGIPAGYYLVGIAYSYKQSKMFAMCTNNTNSSRLFTLNMTTGALTFIATLLPNGIYMDIAFSRDETLYSIELFSNDIYSVNISTGLATVQVPISIDFQYAQGLYFDKETDLCYLTGTTSSPSFGLYRINISTASIFNIGSLPVQTVAFAIPGPENVTVTGAVTGNGSYYSIEQAIWTLNNHSQTGANIEVTLKNSFTLSEPLQINANTWNSLLITPAGTGNYSINGVFYGDMVILNGADNVTIDGLNKNLTIKNSLYWFDGSAIAFTNGAENNTIQNVNIECYSPSDQGTGIVRFKDGGTTGNNNNIISNCHIGSTISTEGAGVFFRSTTSPAGINNKILNSTIQNCTEFGIDSRDGYTGSTFNDNRIYNSNTVTYDSAVNRGGISVSNTTGSGFTITGNVIGYANSSGTGMNKISGSKVYYYPIYISAADDAVSLVSDNEINGYTFTGDLNGTFNLPLRCIYIGNGKVNTIGNKIGSLTTPGIFLNTTSSGSRSWGIYYEYSADTCITSGNLIGGIQLQTGASDKWFTGIRHWLGDNAVWTVENNVIGGDQDTSIYATGEIYGIHRHGTGKAYIKNNLIKNLSSSVQNYIVGINVRSGYNEVENNFVHSFSNNGLGLIYGLIAADGTNKFINNMVYLSNNGSPEVFGLIIWGNHNEVFNNSFYIGGSSADGYSYCLYKFNQNHLDIKNNIFVNTRENLSNNKKNFGFVIWQPEEVTSDYNVVWLPGNTKIYGYTPAGDAFDLDQWNAMTGFDLNSHSHDPHYVNVSEAAPDLHIASGIPTPVESNGTFIASITKDYDGQERSILTPVDIGADAGDFTSLATVLKLTAFRQGFYDPAADTQIRDTIRVYLRNSSAPYAIIDSAIAYDSANGTSQLTFNNISGGSYYIQVKHRNAIETWSSSPVLITSGATTYYDFSDAQSKAYDNNQLNVDASPSRFAFYEGDVNQDGIVNISDIIAVNNASSSFVTGYVPADVNGDNIVNIADLTITFNNAASFVQKKRP